MRACNCDHPRTATGHNRCGDLEKAGGGFLMQRNKIFVSFVCLVYEPLMRLLHQKLTLGISRIIFRVSKREVEAD
jgi:hypothetical protein